MSWRAPKEWDQTTPASPYTQQQSSCVRGCIFFTVQQREHFYLFPYCEMRKILIKFLKAQYHETAEQINASDHTNCFTF